MSTDSKPEDHPAAKAFAAALESGNVGEILRCDRELRKAKIVARVDDETKTCRFELLLDQYDDVLRLEVSLEEIGFDTHEWSADVTQVQHVAALLQDGYLILRVVDEKSLKKLKQLYSQLEAHGLLFGPR